MRYREKCHFPKDIYTLLVGVNELHDLERYKNVPE